MPQKIDLSEKAIRDKLHYIASELYDDNLREAAEKGCIRSIALIIAESHNVEPIVSKLFLEFPEAHKIVPGILRYKNSKYVMHKVLENIGRVAFFTGDSDTVSRVAQALGSEKVHKFVHDSQCLYFDDFIDAVSIASYISPDTENAEMVADIANRLKDEEGLFEAIRDVSEAAYLSRNPAIVKAVAEKYLSKIK